MNIISILPVKKQTSKIAYTVCRSLIAICADSTIYLYHYEVDNSSFIFSFQINGKYCLQMSFNDNKFATMCCLYVLTNDCLYIVFFEKKEIIPFKVSAQSIIIDKFLPSSFILLTNSTIDHYTLNTKNETGNPVIQNWTVDLTASSTIVKTFFISEESPNYAISLTKSNSVIIFYRQDVNLPFKIIKTIGDLPTMEIPISAATTSSDLFVICSVFSVFLYNPHISFIFEAFRVEIPIVQVFSLNCNNILTLHANGIVKYHHFNDSSRFEKVSEYDFQKDVQFEGYMNTSNRNVFLLRDEKLDIIYNLFIKNEKIEVESEYSILQLSSELKMAAGFGRIAFLNHNQNIHIIDSVTFKTLSVHQNSSSISNQSILKFDFYSKNILIILKGDYTVERVDFADKPQTDFTITKYRYTDVKNLVVTPNHYLSILTKTNELIIFSIDGSSFESRHQFKNIITFSAGVHPSTNEFIVVASVPKYGLVILNSAFDIIGSFNEPNSSYPYRIVTMQSPLVFAFDDMPRLFLFDLLDNSCAGPISIKNPVSIVLSSIPKEKGQIFLSEKNNIFVLTKDLKLVEQIPIQSSLLLNGQLQTERKGNFGISSSLGYYEMFYGDFKIAEIEWENVSIPTFCFEMIENELKCFLKMIETSAQTCDEYDDICSLLNYPNQKRDYKDFCRFYHSFFLSFKGADLNEEAKQTLYKFAEQFSQSGNYLTAASICHLMNDYDSAISHLLMSDKFYNVSLVYAFKYDKQSYDLILLKYVDFLISSGNQVKAISILLAKGMFDKAISILIDHEMNKSLVYINRLLSNENTL